MAEAALTPIVRQPNGAQNWAISALIAAAVAAAHQARNRRSARPLPTAEISKHRGERSARVPHEGAVNKMGECDSYGQ